MWLWSPQLSQGASLFGPRCGVRGTAGGGLSGCGGAASGVGWVGSGEWRVTSGEMEERAECWLRSEFTGIAGGGCGVEAEVGDGVGAGPDKVGISDWGAWPAPGRDKVGSSCDRDEFRRATTCSANSALVRGRGWGSDEW
jgi:hypothetical protein